MVDRYIIGETSHISPEAPVPVVMAGREEVRADLEERTHQRTHSMTELLPMSVLAPRPDYAR